MTSAGLYPALPPTNGNATLTSRTFELESPSSDEYQDALSHQILETHLAEASERGPTPTLRPELPPDLRGVSLRVRYECLRLGAFYNTALRDITDQDLDSFEDYNTIFDFFPCESPKW